MESNTQAQQTPDPVLGVIPKDPINEFPPNVHIIVESAGDEHDAQELAAVALREIKRREGQIATDRFRFYVIIKLDNPQVMAEVIVGEGIGKPCWNIIFNRKMAIQSYVKGLGRG